MVNAGHLLENMVFTHLRTMSERIHYYRTTKGREVDFIWQPAGEAQWQLVQVCETMLHPDTRNREMRALEEAMRERGVEDATIVTRNEEECVETDAGTIHIVPIWRYLLP